MNSKKFAKNLIDFIYNSPTAFHAVSTSKELLDANGFIELESCKMWDIKVGGKYYITKKIKRMCKNEKINRMYDCNMYIIIKYNSECTNKTILG